MHEQRPYGVLDAHFAEQVRSRVRKEPHEYIYIYCSYTNDNNDNNNDKIIELILINILKNIS